MRMTTDALLRASDCKALRKPPKDSPATNMAKTPSLTDYRGLQVKSQLSSANVLLGSHVPDAVSGSAGLQETVLNEREQRVPVFHLSPSPQNHSLSFTPWIL